MEREELDEIEVGLDIDEETKAVKLWVGDNVAYLTIDEAMTVAEGLAEMAGVLEGMADAEPVNANTHQAPKTIQ